MLRKIYYLLSFVSVSALGLSSCDIINPGEQEPSWLHIDSFSLSANPENAGKEGSLSHDITDAWVFVDDEMIGIFELPVTIPILDEGKHKLTVGPGIKVSTVSTLRDNYLFYEAFIQEDFELKRGEITVLNPTVRYRSAGENYEYMVVEDFNDPNKVVQFDTVSGSDAGMEITTDPALVFEGAGSGVININASNSVVVVKTKENYELPNLGKVVYMELNYYTDFEVTLGVYVNNNIYQDEVVDYLTLRPTTDSVKKWKKAYVALTSVISGAVNPVDYYFYFNVNFGDGEVAGKDGKVMIDNVKLLYQK